MRESAEQDSAEQDSAADDAAGGIASRSTVRALTRTTARSGEAVPRRRTGRKSATTLGALGLLFATAACGAAEPGGGTPDASAPPAATPAESSPGGGTPSPTPAESEPDDAAEAPIDTADWATADNGLFTFVHPQDWAFRLDEEGVGYELADPQGETVAYVSKGQFQGDSDTGGELWSAEEIARETITTNASAEQIILTSVKQRSDEGAEDTERDLMVQLLEPANVDVVLGDTGGQPFWFRTDDDTAAVFMTDDDLLELEGVDTQADERQIAQFLESEQYRTILEIMRSVQVK